MFKITPTRLSSLVSRYLLMPSLAPEVEDGEGWQTGPHRLRLGRSGCLLELTTDQQFADSGTTQMMMDAAGNRPSGLEIGLVPLSASGTFLLFEYDDVGYIDDRPVRDIDHERLYLALEMATSKGNRYRSKLGIAAMELVGWIEPPHYEVDRHVLSWAVAAEQGPWRNVVNHTWCFLGLSGSVTVTLVAAHAQYELSVIEASETLSRLAFVKGRRYEDYAVGDKRAGCDLVRWLVESLDLSPARLPTMA